MNRVGYYILTYGVILGSAGLGLVTVLLVHKWLSGWL